MQDSIDPRRLTHPSRARLLAAATLVSGILLAGCGGSSPRPATSAAGGTSNTAPSPASAPSTGPSAGAPAALAFAECMRSNGVPKFPDPQDGGGVVYAIPAGTSPSSPAFKAANAKCQEFTGGGPPGPGSTTHPSAQTLAKLLKIARCMRQHGVPQFPDPQASVPPNPLGSGIDQITDFDGAILLFPSAINVQSPAYKQALTACGAPPLGLPH